MTSSFIGYFYYSNHNDFNSNISSLLYQIPEKEKVVSLTFFATTSNSNYRSELSLIKKKLSSTFGVHIPLVSYVAQSLASSEKMAVEAHYFPFDGLSRATIFKQLDEVRYAVFEWKNSKILLTEGVRANLEHESVSRQGEEIFQKIEAILSAESMSIHEIVRQWNYIGKITEINNNIQNYQAFNDARAHFYEKDDWKNIGYPAATGIGTELSSVMVSLIAVSANSDIQILPIDNPLQTAAYEYSQSVLIGEDCRCKENPKFERAKLVQNGSGLVCFISGTAAIQGEESICNFDISLQTRQTIETIRFLISPENLRQQGIDKTNSLELVSLRVYIKKKAHFERTKKEIEYVWPNVPVIYLQADICRRELLVEVEALAVDLNYN